MESGVFPWSWECNSRNCWVKTTGSPKEPIGQSKIKREMFPEPVVSGSFLFDPSANSFFVPRCRTTPVRAGALVTVGLQEKDKEELQEALTVKDRDGKQLLGRDLLLPVFWGFFDAFIYVYGKAKPKRGGSALLRVTVLVLNLSGDVYEGKT